MSIIDVQHDFYGRSLVLDTLRKRINGLKEGFRQNLALVGSRTIGKSAIIHKLLQEHDDPDVLLIYLDLENKDFRYFARQLTKSVLYHYLKSRNLSVQEDLKLLCATCNDSIPQTVAAIEVIMADLDAGNSAKAYGALLGLTDIFYAETKKSLVLIFDEFGELEQFDIPDVYTELGRRIMTQKNCLYIVTSSYPIQAQTILSEKLSLLFGNFETITLGAFDLNDTYKLLEHHLQDLKIGLQLRGFIGDFTGGYPLYINILAQEMVCLCGMHKQTEIYAPILTQSVENLLFNPWGVLSRHFELKLNDLSKGKTEGVLANVLIALSQGKHRIVDLVEHLGLKSSQVSSRINALLLADIVEKNGNYFHIKDKLFKYWIKYVLERRMFAIELEPGKSRKSFKEEIVKAVNDFHVTARKDLSSRMVDLAHKFDNESFELAGRRYKLSQFREVKGMKIRLGAGNYIDSIVANGDEGQWLFVLKKDPLLDHDLHLFVEEIKKMSPRPNRSVIVSLSGMDDNAKIRALQEKLWIWNEEEINTLMHLYDEPLLVK